MFSKLFTALLLLVCTAAAASNLPQSGDVIQYGGSAASPGSNLNIPRDRLHSSSTFTLHATTASQTDNNHLILYLGRGVASQPYQVSSTSTFYVTEVQQNGGAVVSWQFCSGSAALVSNDTATAPTGVHYQLGATSRNQGLASAVPYAWHIPYMFLPGTFPCIQTVGGGANASQWQVTGFER